MDINPMLQLQKRIEIQEKVLAALERAGRGKDQAAQAIRRQLDMLHNALEELQSSAAKQSKTQSEIRDYLSRLLNGRDMMIVDAMQLGLSIEGKACLVSSAAAVNYMRQQFVAWSIDELIMLAGVDLKRRIEFHKAKAMGAIGWFLEGPEFENDRKAMDSIFGGKKYA